MKSNSKTVQPRKPSHIREFLWIVYKWGLTSMCMYFCYRILHLQPDVYFGELLACSFITGCFILAINCHKMLKKGSHHPDFSDDGSLFFLHLLNLGFYAGLYMFSSIIFDFRLRKVLSNPYMLCLAVVYVIVPFLYYFLFLD